MTMDKRFIAALSILLATAAVAYDMHHPNLRDAYHDLDNAIKHVQIAQAANRGIEFGGHAEKAVDAMQHAQNELVAGDMFNDAHHH
jgi:hypothetical protein